MVGRFTKISRAFGSKRSDHEENASDGAFVAPLPTDAPDPAPPATKRSAGSGVSPVSLDVESRSAASQAGAGPTRPVTQPEVQIPPGGTPSVTLDVLSRAKPASVTSTTQPEMPAVQELVPPSLDVLSRAKPASVTSTTQPEMPPVQELVPPSLDVDSLSPYADAKLDTDPSELARSTDLGAPPAEAEERDRAVLLRMDGAHAGQVVSVGAESIQIGRHPTTNLTIQDRGVSRIHARVYREHGVHWIEDLGSRNCTYVQGRQVDHCVLEDGDWVQLGPRVSFRYSLTDARQEELLRRLFDSSTRDALTGAYNRKHFDERLAAETAYALRHGTTVSLVMFDIDHFKQINDTHGHRAGDAVLRHIAGTVSARLRSEDVFARYGGEEFCVILRGIDIKGAARVGERVRAMVGSSLVYFEGAHIPVCVSAGCASLDCIEERTAEALLAATDRRLYLAKRAGRNRVVAADCSEESPGW